MSHRLVQEQLDQLTALLTAHEDVDLEEEELLLFLTCGLEDAAAGVSAPISVCLNQLDEEACGVFNCSFVPDCFLLHFSLFLCCWRRKFKRSPADFLERPAKRPECRVTNSWATSSGAGCPRRKTPTPLALACHKRSISLSNRSRFNLVAMLQSRLGTRTKTSQNKGCRRWFQAVTFPEMIDGTLLRFRFC